MSNVSSGSNRALSEVYTGSSLQMQWWHTGKIYAHRLELRLCSMAPEEARLVLDQAAQNQVVQRE